MQDYVMKGTGNSRYLKSVPNFLSLYPTYEDFVAALVQGNLPIDLNGINASGWSQQGTPLNKANLLSDATAAQYGYSSSAVPNQIFAYIKNYINTVPNVNKIVMVDTGTVASPVSSPFRLTLAASGIPVIAFLLYVNTDPKIYNFFVSTSSHYFHTHMESNNVRVGGGYSSVNGNSISLNDFPNWVTSRTLSYVILSKK